MMWRLGILTLWLWNGGTMNEPKPLVTGPPLEPVTELPVLPPLRTIHDIEADLALAGAELAHHRSRRGDTTNNLERVAERPAETVHELNWLLAEWANHKASG